MDPDRNVLIDSEILKEITLQTDRGAAIMAAELLSVRLRDAIRANLADEIRTMRFRSRVDPIDTRLFEGTGPLSTLSSRIDIAFAIRIIGENTYRDLHRIRLIRNKFAHTFIPIDFTNNSVASMCNGLWIPENLRQVDPASRQAGVHINDVRYLPPPTLPREKLMRTMTVVWSGLYNAIFAKDHVVLI